MKFGKAVLVFLLVAGIFQATVGMVMAQGPVYNNPYNGGFRGYVYESGYGYQSAYHNAGVAGRHYYRQAYTYVRQETSFTPNNTFNWVAGQGGW